MSFRIFSKPLFSIVLFISSLTIFSWVQLFPQSLQNHLCSLRKFVPVLTILFELQSGQVGLFSFVFGLPICSFITIIIPLNGGKGKSAEGLKKELARVELPFSPPFGSFRHFSRFFGSFQI